MTKPLEDREVAKTAKETREEIEEVGREVVDAAIAVDRGLGEKLMRPSSRNLRVLRVFAVLTPSGES